MQPRESGLDPQNAPRVSGHQKYAVVVVDWLRDLGYTHCFFVAGGNIMHLLDAVRSRMTCVPFVHEVGAGVAAEFFNEIRGAGGERAFALVTAGPGLTNIVTALAGAYLESRELLVLGGQVKSTDLAGPELRQRGIQEIDGISIARPICVAAERLERPVDRANFARWVERGRTGRKGPVFLEFCLDVQAAPVDAAALDTPAPAAPRVSAEVVAQARAAAAGVAESIRSAQRPVLLLGGGVSRETARSVRPRLSAASVGVMTTWNGLDRVDARDRNYFGRPNTWGQRAANVLIQQADLIVAIGTRLGLQQTGFNHAAFAPLARVVQVEIDPAELAKGHPKVDVPVLGDADAFLESLLAHDLGGHEEWLAFGRHVRERLPSADPENRHASGFLDPYEVMLSLSGLCTAEDLIVPCSSGGAYTAAMQAFEQRFGQFVVSDKGLASMGYGLSGAIGAALARPGRRTILCEGDGGFAQNLQELGTVAVNRLPLKMFLVCNEGYASIRMTQRNYFGGQYVGCDVRTGLGFPDWEKLFAAYGISALVLGEGWDADAAFLEQFGDAEPRAFVVPVDPEQTYFPKITSRLTSSGSMESSPLHLMSPDLPADISADVLRYLNLREPAARG